MGSTAGKVWGQTTQIFTKQNTEIHDISIEPHSKCSKHCHKTKFNGFYCLDGVVTIRVWKNDYDLVDETILMPNEYTEVRPNEYHQFQTLQCDCRLLEFYWTELDTNDITREGHGCTAKDFSIEE